MQGVGDESKDKIAKLKGPNTLSDLSTVIF